jgi:hypothetical protein
METFVSMDDSNQTTRHFNLVAEPFWTSVWHHRAAPRAG